MEVTVLMDDFSDTQSDAWGEGSILEVLPEELLDLEADSINSMGLDRSNKDRRAGYLRCFGKSNSYSIEYKGPKKTTLERIQEFIN